MGLAQEFLQRYVQLPEGVEIHDDTDLLAVLASIGQTQEAVIAALHARFPGLIGREHENLEQREAFLTDMMEMSFPSAPSTGIPWTGKRLERVIDSCVKREEPFQGLD